MGMSRYLCESRRRRCGWSGQYWEVFGEMRWRDETEMRVDGREDIGKSKQIQWGVQFRVVDRVCQVLRDSAVEAHFPEGKKYCTIRP